jgi:predicted CxxxxCH...CXXCH cytochrome family protein
MRTALIALLLAGCGGRWEPGSPPHTADFLLECEHARTGCDGCHTAGEPLRALDPECISCHLEQRPASHDPETTGACEDCHQGSCGWEGVSPHPSGFSEPEAHGLEAKLQGPTEGDCRDCHGADLRGGATPEGGSARGCDECHADQGAAEWRTDCTFCHGGADNATGAPPREIDGGTDPASASFRAHGAHVDDDGDYRALDCTECHGILYQDGLEPEHWFDATPGAAEGRFDRGVAQATLWDGNGGCANNYCHGRGQRSDGVVRHDAPAMDCESCHRTESGWNTMSGLHQAHLAEDASITCNDCHAAVIDRDGFVDGPGRHVDGVRDVSFFEGAISSTNGGGTCTGVCHGTEHDTLGWGHVPDYEDPELHGLDSNLQATSCGSCHGADWTGGVAQGCDDCHAQEGAPGWRTDCTFCHGGDLDGSGAPPRDLDGDKDKADLSFGAHPEHTADGTGTIGHPTYGCAQCHQVPTDGLTPGHAIDGTAARAEVDLTAGDAFEGGYDPSSRTCSNLYCHGDGQTPSGVVSDGDGALDCDACHATTTGWTAMSGTHATHLDVSGVTCADCHAPVVNAANDVVDGDRHVDRAVDLDLATTGWVTATTTCTISCHGEDHDGFGWSGPHPDGFEAPELHGQEALLRLQVCTGCHGADLDGGTAQGCDGCHADSGHADWRSDCVYCHGGADGDVDGAPPQDIDNQTAGISFQGHRAHLDGDIHPSWDCRTCHDGAQTYADAFADAGHWFDTTPRVAEVRFWGDAAGTSYASRTCSDSYCHGNGQTNGTQVDQATPLDCDGCHSYAFDRGDLSGTHALHLGEAGVTCADCHSVVVDAAGAVTAPARHVDGVKDVDNNATVGWNAAARTCSNSCHNHTHSNVGWNGGHPPGYDDPLQHGQDALFVFSDCATSGCHGTDLVGGASGQGCNSCHTAGWRSDCAFCHGTRASDGMPPEDLDNTTNEANLTFMAHPEHGDGDTHPLWGCETCHGAASASYSDAFTDNGHWLDASPGLAEVSFTGIAAGGSYAAAASTCSNLYCHGTGVANGSETDSDTALGCAACHGDPPSTGEHRDHDHDAYPCTECHADTSNSAGAIVGADVHVDGSVDVVMNGALNSVSWTGSRCSGSCHGEGHSSESW